MVNCGAVVAANAIIIYDQLRATKERKMHYFMEKWSLSALHQENQNHHRLYEFDIRIIITVGQSSIACLAAIVTKHKAYIVAFGAEYVLVLLHIHAMNEIILSFTLLYQLILILLLLLLALQLQPWTAFSFWAFSFSCLNFQMIRLLARCCALWILWHTFRWKLLFLSLSLSSLFRCSILPFFLAPLSRYRFYGSRRGLRRHRYHCCCIIIFSILAC